MPLVNADAPKFRDVRQIFEDAANEMAEGEVILADNFTLHEAMSGFEIGEPRLDSGMISPGEEVRPAFDPLALLLPQEVCWLIDRSFACEVEWHAGNPLSQTVFTMLHVHHLAAINPEYIPAGKLPPQDLRRPSELVTLVLRAAIFGLLKSCDLAWRILAQDRTYDGEDWQSEKCDVSMMEGVKVALPLNKLNQAITWVTTHLRGSVCQALSSRLLLRKTMLEILDADVFANPAHLSALILRARSLLSEVISHPSLEPEAESPAMLAIDPYVGRTLISFIPLRKLELPSAPHVWDTIRAYLDAMQELLALSQTHDLAIWDSVGNLRAWMPHLTLRTAMMRTLAQTIFHHNNTTLNQHPSSWVVDQFALSSLGCSWSTIIKIIQRCTIIPELALEELTSEFSDLILDQIRIAWFNPPRRRRQLVNFIPRWLNLLILLHDYTGQVPKTLHHHPASRILPSTKTNNSESDIMLVSRSVWAVQSWRLATLQDVMLSGFQLELYSPSERAFAYWYTSIIIDGHLQALDILLGVVPQASSAYLSARQKHVFLSALQAMTIPMFAICSGTQELAWDRQQNNVMRRYKWAFEFAIQDVPGIPLAAPDFHCFISSCSSVLQTDFSLGGSFRHAQELLKMLILSPNVSLGRWTHDTNKFLSLLAETCEDLSCLPNQPFDLTPSDTGCLIWDPMIDPWFPRLRRANSGSQLAPQSQGQHIIFGKSSQLQTT